MAEGITDVPEQLAGSSIKPSHEVQIDPNPKPPHPKAKATSIRDHWLCNLEEREERPKGPKPKQGQIHRVPDRLLANKREDYEPKVVSLGPYHFGEEKLSDFQKLKRSMADRLVSDDKALEASLRSEIRNNIGSLRNAYSLEKIEGLEHNDQWEEMLFLDGCFVLYFIFCITYDRVEDLKIKRYELCSVHSDLFLAENQLPFRLIKILSGNDSNLLDLVDEYIYTHKISNDVDRAWRRDEPVHLLGRLRTIIIGSRSETQKCQHAIWSLWQLQPTLPPGTKKIVLRSAKELTPNRIHLKPTRTGLFNEISFRSHFIYGTLRLPKITIDDSTSLLFMNLLAYEMCAPVDPINTSYIFLLDSLVNHVDDIKELQSAGVLVNHLATDEEAAILFNEMSRGLRLDRDEYRDVRRKIGRFLVHMKHSRLASWMAEVYANHFTSPLAAKAALGGLFYLVLTLAQTYFTIFPRGNK